MAVLFGLDMKEMQWFVCAVILTPCMLRWLNPKSRYKFGSKYMFGNKDYYLRRTKFIVYQLAMIFCVVSESLGTDVLSNFVDSQDFLLKHDPNAIEHNDSYVGMASYNIFSGIFVATVFGAAFFFDLFWPARHEDRGVRLAWKGCSVAACIFMLASIICEVVIVTTRFGYVTGVPENRAYELLRQYGGYPLQYSKNGRAIASVVFAWLGFPCVVASTIIMWMSINHTEKFGPYSQHVRSTSKNTFNSIDSDEEAGQKSGASELNNLRGNHYEPPGIHVEPAGKQHENPTQVPELSKPAPAVAPRTSATYDGT